MSNLKKRVLSFCLSIVFVLAALAVPLTTGAEENGHFCYELPNDCSHCADHDAADVCDETTEIRYVPPITDPDCGCSSANAGTYTTNTNSGNVNIRAGHGTDTTRIGSIPRGTYFTVDFASATWAHVNYNGTIGYVSMSVIKKVSSNTDPSCSCSTANAGTYTTNTNGGNVRIRAGHGTNTDVIGVIPYGSTFSVTAASNDWAHVGNNGYVSMSVIKKVSGNPAPAVIQQDRHYSTYSMTAAYRVKLKERMNCYGYAIHVYSDGEAYDYNKLYQVFEYGPYRQQPGEFSHTYDYVDAELLEALNKTEANDALNIIERLIYDDFASLCQSHDNEWTIQSTEADDIVPAGCRKIALVVRLRGNKKDFHFYLRHSNGTWSHKRGALLAQNTSIDNALLLNDGNIDIAAMEDGYSDGIRYYLIGKSAVIDYCHEAGHYSRKPSHSALQTTPAFTDRAGAEPVTSKTISETLTGARFDYSGDIDYYAFTPTQSGIYTIKTSITSSAHDVDIVVGDSRNVPIASSTDSENAVLTVYLAAGNTYYIKVSDAKYKVATYTLYVKK